jgi:23S rRNA (cytidine1920-2'-O)/16S rRNA (cytidine1409-2'-O)-methyltransferase
MATRVRLDQELVRRGLASGRDAAARLVDERSVLVDGVVADKPARLVLPSCALELVGPPSRFVSRGGEKLQAAIEAFGVDLSGRTVLDVGSSTGGFTDCSLQAGARRVVSIDVGTNQLHERIRSDPRVAVYEQTDARTLTQQHLIDADAWPIDIVVADLSFVSLRVAIVHPLKLVADGATQAVLLVKPQFEATRAEANKTKGIIKDPAIWARVLDEVTHELIKIGWTPQGLIRSPIVGGHGNVEFLLHLIAPGRKTAGWDVQAAIAAVCDAEAADRQD